MARRETETLGESTAGAGAARRSPPTERVVQVLDHLVARPGVRFGLSELARELDLSKPTCLGILTVLADAGYLVRDPVDKTYGLGPALIVAGRAAQRGFASGPVAHRHLAALAEEFGVMCSASAVVGDRIAVLDVVGGHGAAAAARVGEVYPFAPPVGLMYVLWDTDERIEQWLRREPTLPVTVDLDDLWRIVTECRRTGYLAEPLTPGGRRLYALMAGVVSHDLAPEMREMLAELVAGPGERVLVPGAFAAGEKRAVNLVAAPAYDPEGHQSLVLTLHLEREVDAAGIERCGAALVAVADAITADLGGRRPAR
ncbi:MULTISPECIES: helix-turn-helix domain-containing protein [Rhodococcus]|uniref:Helix-turn-helix domain-containing protein n=1 Tax=Rhodococcus rhodochrous TaxID=1829 RepID=A0AAW4XL37_RHORH|nr:MULTISPECIES: helix-turn-helix domain-containing protein [Rhodococcus]MCD2113870.1 helix-turn-helix domain-containing protein [Rhodococcus rhodochrous]QHG84267.1 MarR family transcriptional regulator [Rhodococcus rhodochrous]QOH55994.1 ArsR family transcriptional regulator [Rhodococcus rhodochrous]WAL48054.1 helix-turn-helix domain-containing protein [Rhodococcus pyridinivorans]